MRAPSPRGPSPPPAPGWRRRAAAAAAGGNSPSCCCGVSGGRLSRGRAGGRAAGLAAAFPRRRRLPRGDRPSLPAGSGFCRGAGLQFGRGVRLTPPRFSRASLGERASLRGVGGRGPAGGSGGTGRGERLALRGSPSQAERRLRGRSAPAGRGVCAGGPVRPSIPPPAAWRRRGAPPPSAETTSPASSVSRLSASDRGCDSGEAGLATGGGFRLRARGRLPSREVELQAVVKVRISFGSFS